MAVLRLTATAYRGLQYLEITDPEEAYTNTDSDTAAVLYSEDSTACDFYGFDFSQIPQNATISNVAYKIKGFTGDGSDNGAYLYDMDGFNQMSSSVAITGDQVYTITLNQEYDFDDVMALGDDFALRVYMQTSQAGDVAEVFVFGMEIEITYTVTVPNKVVYNGNTLIDLTGDDVTAADVLSGVLFHLPSGEQGTGSLVLPSGLEYESGTWSPSSNVSRGTIDFAKTHSTTPWLVATWSTKTTMSQGAMNFVAFDNTAWGDNPDNTAGIGNYYVAYVNSSYSRAQTSGYINYGGSNSGSSSTSYFRYFADESAMYPYGYSGGGWKTNNSYRWVAVWAPTT